MRRKFRVDVKGFIFSNFWWKIASLVIAVITWLYVNGELTRGIKI